MKVCAAFCFLQILSMATAGQENVADKKIYSAGQLQEDYIIFRKALETTYPSLYRFSDSTTFTRYLDDQFRLLEKPATETTLYKIITLACAKANDEHLIPTPSKNYYRHLQHSKHFFPFSLKITNRRLYVLKHADGDSVLPLGSEILSVNGHSAEDILTFLLPTIPSDGYIQTFNIRHLEDYSMTQNENLFDLNYPIFIEDTDAFRIEFIHPDKKSEKKLVTVRGLDYNAYEKFYRQRTGYKAPLEFRYINNDIAYLRISSFLKYHRNDFKQDFYLLFDSIFKQLALKNTKNLILDLRNNEGGDGTGEKLITFLLDRPYKHYDYTEEMFTGYPPVVDYLENGKELFFIDSLVYKTGSGKYRLKEAHYNRLYKIQQPDSNNFKGKLYVLINGASGSMASVVATFVKAHNTRATFIGEESGGTMEGNTSDSFAKLLLPNTQIRVEIPLTKKLNNVNFIKGRGVFPDYAISPAMDDIIAGVDTELNFAIGLINSKR